MGVVAVNSTPMANAVATPRVSNTTGTTNGNLVRAVNAKVAVTSGDSSTSVYRFGRIRSSDYIDHWRFTTADIGTTTAASFGLHDTVTHTNGGAVVSVGYFATAVTLNAGAVDTETMFTAGGSGQVLYTNCEKAVWEVLGLSSDPNKEYDVTATLTGAADAAGTISMRVYVVR